MREIKPKAGLEGQKVLKLTKPMEEKTEENKPITMVKRRSRMTHMKGYPTGRSRKS